MLDTVKLGYAFYVEGGSRALESREWGVGEWRKDGKLDVWAARELAGVRFTWRAYRGGWLSAEVSLPKLALGDNAELLTSWVDCRAALELVREVAETAVGERLPDLDRWTISRADPVWAWACDPTPYLAALRVAGIPGTQAQHYPGGIEWATAAGHRKRCRCYDKARQCGVHVALPLRLECQVTKLAKRSVKLPDGKRVGSTVGAWGAGTALGLVGGAMHDLGLDRPIPTLQGARVLLQAKHGRRTGETVFRALLTAHVQGGWGTLSSSRRTVQHYRQLLSEAGVGALAECELPALASPPIGP